MPERLLGVLRQPVQANHVPALDDDHDPRQDRHHEQRDRDGACDEITLRPDVRDTVALHFCFL
jgi:hypothetical protein